MKRLMTVGGPNTPPAPKQDGPRVFLHMRLVLLTLFHWPSLLFGGSENAWESQLLEARLTEFADQTPPPLL